MLLSTLARCRAAPRKTWRRDGSLLFALQDRYPRQHEGLSRPSKARPSPRLTIFDPERTSRTNRSLDPEPDRRTKNERAVEVTVAKKGNLVGRFASLVPRREPYATVWYQSPRIPQANRLDSRFRHGAEGNRHRGAERLDRPPSRRSDSLGITGAVSCQGTRTVSGRPRHSSPGSPANRANRRGRFVHHRRWCHSALGPGHFQGHERRWTREQRSSLPWVGFLAGPKRS